MKNTSGTNLTNKFTLPLSLFYLSVLCVLCGALLSACSKPAAKAPDGMVVVPSGEFIMGSNKTDDGESKKFYKSRPFYVDEHPERRVFLNTYYIDIFEVNNEQYKRFKNEFNFDPDKAKHPVVNVSWYDADQYCISSGKSLPRESEWEKAARGTDSRQYPWGNEFKSTKANTGELTHDTTPVGSYKEGISPYGVYDMAGNVWEWTKDWYKPYKGNTYVSDAFGEKFKVIRGGARVSKGHYNLPQFFRSAHRLGVPPESISTDTGFRCISYPK